MGIRINQNKQSMKKEKISIPITPGSFDVQGVERNYLLAENESADSIILVFHGNGGTADGFAKKYALEKVFIHSHIIYLQGIPGIGGGFDPKGLKNGWQRKKGDGNDRDLIAIDILIKLLTTKYPELKNKIYAMGHSNGGRFAYLLWQQRPEHFAGFIINAHQATDLFTEVLTPKSAFISTGKKDNVVNNANQFKTVDIVKSKLDLRAANVIDDALHIYNQPGTAIKLVHFIHEGGHDLPKTALRMIQEHFL